MIQNSWWCSLGSSLRGQTYPTPAAAAAAVAVVVSDAHSAQIWKKWKENPTQTVIRSNFPFNHSTWMFTFFFKSSVWEENLDSPHCPGPWPAPLRLQWCVCQAPRREAPAVNRRRQPSSLQLVSCLLGDTTVRISNNKINYFWYLQNNTHLWKIKIQNQKLSCKLGGWETELLSLSWENLWRKWVFPVSLDKACAYPLSSSRKRPS